MKKCRKCGQNLSSNGYCHNCFTYDDLTTTKFKIVKSCDVCNKKFHSLTQFEEHIKTHPFCNLCGIYFKYEKELTNHLKNHECPFCHGHFHPLGDHLRTHIYCTYCNILFSSYDELYEHIDNHHKCSYCHMRLGTPNDLKEHIEKNHLCTICGECARHLELHKMQNHPRCSHCHKRFLNKTEFDNHLKNCKSYNKYCYYAQLIQSETDRRLRERQEAIKKGTKTVKCPFCTKLFATESGKNQHVKAVHPTSL